MGAIVISILTIIANIAITIYNAGKNRVVYDIKEVLIDPSNRMDSGIGDAKKLLSEGKYTILSFSPDPSATYKRICLLGKIKK